MASSDDSNARLRKECGVHSQPPFDRATLKAANEHLKNRKILDPERWRLLCKLLVMDFDSRMTRYRDKGLTGEDLRTLPDYFHLLELGDEERAPLELLIAVYKYRERCGQKVSNLDYHGYDHSTALNEWLQNRGNEVAQPKPLYPRRIRPLWVIGGLGLAALAAVLLFIPFSCHPPTHSSELSIGLPKTVTLKLTTTESLEFVLIDPTAQPDHGLFQMGSSQENLDLLRTKKWNASEDEEIFSVKLRGAYYLSRTEVTRGQYEAFEQDAKWATSSGKGWDETTKKWRAKATDTWQNPGFAQGVSHPVVLVGWKDARAFAGWVNGTPRLSQQVASQLSGSNGWVGLPSEAEWEYACRAGSTTLFPFGNNELGLVNHGNVQDLRLMDKLNVSNLAWKQANADDGYTFTAPVGKFQLNAFGLRDMIGNVWEWCEDRRGQANDMALATYPASQLFVLRGGSWRSEWTSCRSAYRHKPTPDVVYADYGFRLCIHLD